MSINGLNNDDSGLDSDFRGIRGMDTSLFQKKIMIKRIQPQQIAAPNLKPEYLPDVFADYVFDEAGRMPCSPDYIAAGLIVALATVAGAKFRVSPKRLDNWQIVPNLWGCIIGTPSTKKTPATNKALRAIKDLSIHERDEFKKLMADYVTDTGLSKYEKKVKDKKIQEALGKDDRDKAKQLINELSDFQKPTERRLVCNDTTTEALGVILAENPNGVLIERDELAGFISDMNKQGREGDRAFYLEAWNGNGSYSVNRISREDLHIENVCVSVFGGIQPDRIKPLVKDATAGGENNDGFLQRFR